MTTKCIKYKIYKYWKITCNNIIFHISYFIRNISKDWIHLDWIELHPVCRMIEATWTFKEVPNGQIRRMNWIQSKKIKETFERQRPYFLKRPYSIIINNNRIIHSFKKPFKEVGVLRLPDETRPHHNRPEALLLDGPQLALHHRCNKHSIQFNSIHSFN